MKKIVLALLLIANSLFAVTISEIMNATPAYARAYITQVDIRDQGQLATKLNTVSYPYWTAGAPYTNLKYTGEVTSWYYTHDYVNFYYYSTYWDQYLNPSDLSRTYIYVNLAGYSNVEVRRTGTTTALPLLQTLADGTKVYLDTGSQAINSYEVKTHIQASDGTVDLYNTVAISRNVK